MRRFFACLALLCAVVGLAVLVARLNEGRAELHTREEADLSAAREALEELSLQLEKSSLTTAGPEQAHMLLAAARAGNTARTRFSALPLDAAASAAVTGLLNQVTDEADALLLTLLAGKTPDEGSLARLSDCQAACERLCGQLAVGSAALLGRAACCGDEADAPPILPLPEPLGLTGPEITREEAAELARHFAEAPNAPVLPAPDVSGHLPAYGFTVELPNMRLSVYITRRGGKLLWMAPEQAGLTAVLSREDCQHAITAYLDTLGFDRMREVSWQCADGLYTAAMVPEQDGVALYADVVHVQVRMDTGRVAGFEATPYWTNHVVRTLPELPDLPEDALLCLLPTEDDEQLCIQTTLRHNGDLFLCFTDAQTGVQLALQKLIITPEGMWPA